MRLNLATANQATLVINRDDKAPPIQTGGIYVHQADQDLYIGKIILGSRA